MKNIGIRWMKTAVSIAVLGLLGPSVIGCLNTGGSSQAVATPPVYVLNVASIANLHETVATVSPADEDGVTTGTTDLSLVYKPGTTVTLTASAADSSGAGAFLGWCDASSTYTAPFTCVAPKCTSMSGLTCTVTMNSNISLLATYPGVTGITLTPVTSSAVVPASVQFTATVNGLGTYTPTGGGAPLPYQGSPSMFTLTGPTTFTGSVGSITSAGLYTTPYPAPTSVTVDAQSTVSPTVAAVATITLTLPPAGAGPAMTVDTGSPTHAISPTIYGINDYGLDSSIPAAVKLPIERWGGDSTTRYNYLVDATNSAADYYFETNFPSTTGYPLMSQFNSQVTQDRKTSTKTLATVPLIGYTTQRIAGACSYSVKKYGAQTVVDPNNSDCGTGILVTPVNGSTTVQNDPTDTSVAIDQSFDSGWVQFLIAQFGTAANGGVAVYGLDNEPEYWSGVHKDVHPNPFTYDELSNKGIAYAAAIKAQDPTALVSGPVISNWTQYFYSALDVADGYNHSPSCPQANPVDRLAHGNIPLTEYYLQQFAAYQTANNIRLLDYVDLHEYFAAAGAAFATTGSTTLQQARLNSTRVFWDSTYTDPAYTDPNNDAAALACKGQPYPPNLINTMKGWVSRDYPGTKLAITEYNWGGQEAINGALAQADILGIFGREGVDLATLWGPPVPTTAGGVTQQLPGIIAFEAYTNYDGKGSHFGETAVTSSSANQGVLVPYGATRAADSALTIVVINKGYADLTDSISLPNLKPNGSAQSYLYNNANLAGIVSQAAVTVTPASGSTPASLSTLFPAQSITVLIIRKPSTKGNSSTALWRSPGSAAVHLYQTAIAARFLECILAFFMVLDPACQYCFACFTDGTKD